MSVNRYQPHVHVLPEDDANSRLAVAFQLELDIASARQFDVLDVAGGWIEVLNKFRSVHVIEMEKYPGRFMVLLIDFDNEEDRLVRAKEFVPAHLIERVLILGVASEPEDLKASLGRSYEQIGRDLAKDCREETDNTWSHHCLRHNAHEIARLGSHFRSILFH